MRCDELAQIASSIKIGEELTPKLLVSEPRFAITQGLMGIALIELAQIASSIKIGEELTPKLLVSEPRFAITQGLMGIALISNRA